MNLRNKLGRFPLTMTVATVLISSLSHAATSQGRTNLNGLKTVLIDAKINLNCTTQTPELCYSRKDISIPELNLRNLKNTIDSMAPSQVVSKKRSDEISALKKENEQLKDRGQELQISVNQERINKLQSDEREKGNRNFAQRLWESDVRFYQPERSDDADAINAIPLGRKTVSFGDVGPSSTLRIENVFAIMSGVGQYKETQVSIRYSPEMMKSFVLKVDRSTSSIGFYGGIQYASESMVAQCEERTIYNTIAGFKTTIAEEHLFCKLPEDRGFLRFKILN